MFSKVNVPIVANGHTGGAGTPLMLQDWKNPFLDRQKQKLRTIVLPEIGFIPRVSSAERGKHDCSK